jgi:sulfite oxidase
MPKTTVHAELSCYGTPVSSGDWEGVKLSDLLTVVGLDPSATSVDFKAQDGYAVSIPIEMALRPDVIVAYDLNGLPLSETLRLVVPNSNGNIWISMIVQISLSTQILSDAIAGTPSLSTIQQFRPSTDAQITLPSPQPTQLQPSPTSALTNSPATVGPTVSPTNVTLPQSDQQVSGEIGSGFSFGNFVWVLVGVCVVMVVVGFGVLVRRSSVS